MMSRTELVRGTRGWGKKGVRHISIFCFKIRPPPHFSPFLSFLCLTGIMLLLPLGVCKEGSTSGVDEKVGVDFDHR